MSKNPKEIAAQIVAKLETDQALINKVKNSPEPYRTMIYNSGFVPNAAEIDGTDEYNAIVDELENIMC